MSCRERMPLRVVQSRVLANSTVPYTYSSQACPKYQSLAGSRAWGVMTILTPLQQSRPGAVDKTELPNFAPFRGDKKTRSLANIISNTRTLYHNAEGSRWWLSCVCFDWCFDLSLEESENSRERVFFQCACVSGLEKQSTLTSCLWHSCNEREKNANCIRISETYEGLFFSFAVWGQARTFPFNHPDSK